MKYSTLAVLLLVAACTTKPVEVRTVTKTYGYPTIPTVKSPVAPKLAIDSLTDADKQDPGTVALKYDASIEQLWTYSQQLKKIIDTYSSFADEVSVLKQKQDDETK